MTSSFNQEQVSAWVQLCEAHADAQRSGVSPEIVESLRVQVAVALVLLIQSSNFAMTEQTSQALLIHLLERPQEELSDPNSDPEVHTPPATTNHD